MGCGGGGGGTVGTRKLRRLLFLQVEQVIIQTDLFLTETPKKVTFFSSSFFFATRNGGGREGNQLRIHGRAGMRGEEGGKENFGGVE